MAGLYLKLNGYEQVILENEEEEEEFSSADEEMSEEEFDHSDLIFLCSGVFIKESWLIAPAHCLVSNNINKKSLEEILYPEVRADNNTGLERCCSSSS